MNITHLLNIVIKGEKNPKYMDKECMFSRLK